MRGETVQSREQETGFHSERGSTRLCDLGPLSDLRVLSVSLSVVERLTSSPASKLSSGDTKVRLLEPPSLHHFCV